MEESKSESTNKSQNNNVPIIVVGAIIIAIIVAGSYLTKSSKTSSIVPSVSPSPEINKKNNSEMVEKNGKKNTGMEPQPTPTLTVDQQTQVKEGLSSETTEKTFNVDGGNFYFAPGEIKVNKGDKVTIVFKNDGGSHNFVLDEFNVESKLIKTGETDTVEFIADKAGTFEYYCSVGQHRNLGMKGKLIVQ